MQVKVSMPCTPQQWEADGENYLRGKPCIQDVLATALDAAAEAMGRAVKHCMTFYCAQLPTGEHEAIGVAQAY